MECKQLVFSGHALQKMFARNISISEIKQLVANGDLIKSYLDDKPYPSHLISKTINGRPLHVVVAVNKFDELCIIVTAYEPDNLIWEQNFKTKK